MQQMRFVGSYALNKNAFSLFLSANDRLTVVWQSALAKLYTKTNTKIKQWNYRNYSSKLRQTNTN